MNGDPSPRYPWLIPAILLVGLFFRGYHYFREPPVWHDEGAMIDNILRRDFGELVGKLDWSIPAPPLFLWGVKGLVVTFGSDILIVRLLPFLAACLTLLLMVPVARALLPARAVPWAVFLAVCCEKFSWHAVEAHPYSTDVLTAMLLLLVWAVGRSRPLSWRIGVYTLLAPVCIFLSYPACFVYGGVLLALLVEVWRTRTRGLVVCYLLLCVVVGVSFLLLLRYVAGPQRDFRMEGCWANFFADWERPLRMPWWVVKSTFDLFRYCAPAAGQLLVPAAVVGGVLLARRDRPLLLLLITPPLLALAAALIHRYPFGGARIMLYAVPGLLLLVAAGVPATLEWLRARSRYGIAIAAVCLALPAVESVRYVITPWRRAAVDDAAEWVLSRRTAGEQVHGNDWAFLYYFRSIGPDFHYMTPAGHRDRFWLLHTNRTTPERRLHEAMGDVPYGWRVEQHREFFWTTVLLVVRDDAPATANLSQAGPGR